MMSKQVEQKKIKRNSVPAALIFLLPALLFFCCQSSAQTKRKGMSFGFHFSPVFSNSFIENNNIDVTEDQVRYCLRLIPGWSFGMEVRKDFNRLIFFQTGLNFLRRNYEMKITENGKTKTTEITFASNEIPLLGLAYIRLSRNIYMDATFGVCFDLFHSDNNDLLISVENNRWISPAMLSGLGLELRTQRSGTFYIGCSYQLFLRKILDLSVYLNGAPPVKPSVQLDISANYFALRFTYLFPPFKNDNSE